jgi:pilus assembly protein CpaB
LKRSNRLILLIGVFLAALAFVIVIVLLGPSGGGGGGGAEASAPPAKIATVMAAKNIALGVNVTADMLTTQDLAAEVRQPGALGDTSQAIGQIARTTVTKGQQVTSFTFAPPSGVSLEVPAGYTGIAVLVDQVSGVGTLIKTGDYVDIVAGISPAFPLLFPEDQTVVLPGSYDPTSVKVLVQGVQVVGTILPPPPAPPADQTGTATAAPAAPEAAGTTLNGQQEIVILAVTPQQAEVIKFAQLDGSITVMLRSPKDFVDESGNPVIPETVTTTGIILKTLITDWGVLPPELVFTVQPSPAPAPAP